MSSPIKRPQTGPLGRIARVAFRRRGRFLLGWLAVIALAVGLSAAFGGDFTADYSAPGSDSRRAQELLDERFPDRSGATVSVVVAADAGVATVRGQVGDLLADLAATPHVTGIDDPFTTPGAVSADGRILVAQARLDVANPPDMPVTDTRKMIGIAEERDSGTMRVALGGPAVMLADEAPAGSEGIGLAVAAFILLLTFGSVVAAGLPLAVAVVGLLVSSSLTGLLILAVDAPTWSTSLATMLGIGIGIDYVLLLVTRFREWRRDGLDPEEATVAAVDTAGRSVVIAGVTVIISMLGLFAMGISYMRGAALVSILSVLVVLAASITLFPALLGYLGRHTDRLRIPLGRRSAPTGRVWLRWNGMVRRHRYLSVIAGVLVLGALAVPFLDVRFGFPDAGSNRPESTTRHAYDLTAEGFGPGANSPLLLAVQLPGSGADQGLARLGEAVAGTEGVARVSPPLLNATRDAAVLTVIPATGPQDERTTDLVERLRDDTIPGASRDSGMVVSVGGVAANSIDSNADLARRIPYLIAGVVLLSMFLLLLAFRSIAVAVKAAVLNLLSVGASYGVIALVLEGGTIGGLVGIDSPTPLPPFVPVLMFAVLFGLSMDYEVFLVSRMRESWVRHEDNARAVSDGLAGTARMITAAAAIMVAVFLAFVPSTEIILKVIGIGMAAAIFLDATLVRLLLVPAVMHILGRANWWIPRRLGRVLPELHVEGHPEPVPS